MCFSHLPHIYHNDSTKKKKDAKLIPEQGLTKTRFVFTKVCVHFMVFGGIRAQCCLMYTRSGNLVVTVTSNVSSEYNSDEV